MDPQLLASLQMVDHHLEVIEDREAKLQRLKALIQVYHLIQEKQMVVVANTINVRRILDMISGTFAGSDYRCLDQNTPEAIRMQSLRSFALGQTSMLLMTTDVSARKDFDFGKAASVLINFDFPMTLQLYLYRIQKRADSETHVYTFFSPHDVRHANSLVIVLEGAGQKVPEALRKMKEQVKAEIKKEDKGHRKGKPDGEEESGSKGSRRPDGRNDRKDHKWDDKAPRDSRRTSGELNHRRPKQHDDRPPEGARRKDARWEAESKEHLNRRGGESGLNRRSGAAGGSSAGRGFSDT